MAGNETIILINEQDLKDGFFTFSTSWQRERDRFVKRLGEDNIVSERVDKDENGKPRWWDVKCKSDRLARATGILKSRSGAGVARTQEQKDILAARLAEFRLKKSSNTQGAA